MRPVRILFAGLFGAAVIASPSYGQYGTANPSAIDNSAAKIQAFGADDKAQAKCAHDIRRIKTAIIHNREVNFPKWEKACPAFAGPIQMIESLSPPLRRGAVLLLFGGDYGSQGGYGNRCWIGPAPIC